MADADDDASACSAGNFNLSVSSSVWSILWVLPKPFKELCSWESLSCIASAEEVFGPLGVSVVMSHQFLDGFLGDVTAWLLFCSGDPVGCWCPSSILNNIVHAISQPQATYAALTKCLQCEWIYILTTCCPRSSDVICSIGEYDSFFIFAGYVWFWNLFIEIKLILSPRAVWNFSFPGIWPILYTKLQGVPLTLLLIQSWMHSTLILMFMMMLLFLHIVITRKYVTFCLMLYFLTLSWILFICVHSREQEVMTSLASFLAPW